MKLSSSAIRRAHVSLLAALGFGVILSAQVQDVPKTMLRMSTRRLEPRPVPGSFAAQARTLWRAGTKYGRVDEPRDVPNRIQRLTIINEPDAWVINLADKSGRHMVDRGPSFEVHLPIFTDSMASPNLKELEFGRELEFFANKGAPALAGEAIDGKATERYETTVGNRTIVLRTYSESKKPARVSLVGGAQTETIEYLWYRGRSAIRSFAVPSSDGDCVAGRQMSLRLGFRLQASLWASASKGPIPAPQLVGASSAASSGSCPEPRNGAGSPWLLGEKR